MKWGSGKKENAAIAQGAVAASASGELPEGMMASPMRRRASRNGAIAFTAALFAVVAAVVLGIWWAAAGVVNLAGVLVAALVAFLATQTLHVVLEWEKAVVLRFGKFNRVAGPGLVFTIPIVEYYTLRVDQRVANTYFGAEETLTSDLVPINVDAVIFWMVWNAQEACTEVEDYAQAVSWLAQASLRKAIGRTTAAEVVTRRDQLDDELKDALEEKLNAWGITVVDVEIRDIVIPKELQAAMAAEAVAERKRNARMVLAEAEADISEMLKDAADVYEESPQAMKLRQMHLAYESAETSDGTLVVPTAYTEGFAEGTRD